MTKAPKNIAIFGAGIGGLSGLGSGASWSKSEIFKRLTTRAVWQGDLRSQIGTGQWKGFITTGLPRISICWG